MDDRTTDPPGGDASAPQPPVPRTGEDGKPVYDQEFFLALARCGREEWNRWRESNSDISVTFAGVDFTANGNGIDFSGYNFGNFANFKACRFADRPNPFLSKSGDEFVSGMAKFSGATFGNYVHFEGTRFGSGCNLSNAKFGEWVEFSYASFGEYANLSGAVFADVSSFSGATFGYACNFAHVAFRGAAFFDGLSVDDWMRGITLLIDNWLADPTLPEERRRILVTPDEEWARHSPGPDSFSTISFAGAQFGDTAAFTSRKFKSRCDFTGARFSQPPSFDGGERLDRLDFYGARIGFAGTLILAWDQSPQYPRADHSFRTPGWIVDSDTANRLRRLRELADTTKNHDLERDLYIEERKAERGILLAQYWQDGWRSLLRPKLYGHCLWIGVMVVFSLFADYGRSFIRPLIALAVSVLLLWWAYTAVLIPPNDPTKLADFHRATWAFAISNAVPFVGALTLERDVKLTLLCGDRPIDAQHALASGQPLCVPIPGRRFQLLALGQSIFSALCIFFAGLALRNYFKLR